MPKNSKTALKRTSIPFEVNTSGNPWEMNDNNPATVPLPNDVIRGLKSNGTKTYAKTWYNQKSMLIMSLKSIYRQIVYKYGEKRFSRHGFLVQFLCP